jgi:hypothetical protein
MKALQSTSPHSVALDRRTTIATAITLLLANIVFAFIQHSMRNPLGSAMYWVHATMAASVAIMLWP